MHPASAALTGVLFFPVTPFTESGEVDVDKLAQHVAKGTDAGPGGVFIACGTGEFHAIEPSELRTSVRTAGDVSDGRVRRRHARGTASVAVQAITWKALT